MQKEKSKILTLFLTFLKIGAFTFGGGYAMIPLIQREIVFRRGWITEDDVLEITVIAESTPGPIAVNTATFVGYQVAGFFGAAAATVGVVLPSFVIITAISYVLRQFESLAAVKYAFFGIRAGVLALLVTALVSMARKLGKNILNIIIALAAFVFTGIFGFDVIPVLIACAVAGLISSLVTAKKADKKTDGGSGE